MAKKGSKDGVPNPGEAGALRHNPFAALSLQREALPEQPVPSPAAPTAEGVGKPAKSAKSAGRLVLRRETKHRGGKPVVIVRGMAAIKELAGPATDQLAKELKQKLGCGGTVERDGEEPQIVLQGDHPAKVAELLRARGYRVDGVTS